MVNDAESGRLVLPRRIAIVGNLVKRSWIVMVRQIPMLKKQKNAMSWSPEIMAARNNAKVGMAGYLTHQWIELYNNLPVAVSVTLSQKAGRPAPSAADTEIKLDLVSNVVNPGWDFTGLGADGFDNSDEVALGIHSNAVNPLPLSIGKNAAKMVTPKVTWSTSTDTYVANHKGTPGAAERSGSIAVAATNPTYKVVINEIGNYANDAHDWVELRNVDQGEW